MVDEGLRYKSYKDTVGKTTVGIGFNMDDSNARGIWISADIEESFNSVYKGETALSSTSVSNLLDACLKGCRTDLASLFPSYAGLPVYVQMSLVNLMFNLGLHKFKAFNTFNGLINSGKFEEASNDLKLTALAKQAPNRIRRVCALLLGDDSEYLNA